MKNKLLPFAFLAVASLTVITIVAYFIILYADFAAENPSPVKIDSSHFL